MQKRYAKIKVRIFPKESYMKKIFALIFVFAIALCVLTACKGEGMIERADGFTFNETTGVLGAKAAKDTEQVDLSNKIIVTEGYTWELYADEAHTVKLDKTKVALNPGENTFYFMMYDDGAEYSECIISIRRIEGLKVEEEAGGVTGSIDIEDLLG